MITLYVQLAGETERETERPLLNKPTGLLHMADTAGVILTWQPWLVYLRGENLPFYILRF